MTTAPPPTRAASPWRVVQTVLFVVAVAIAVSVMLQQREALRAAAGAMVVDWRWILAASGLILAVYAMLVAAWIWLIRGWGGRLPYGRAVAIWTVSNLGRYLPGKVWSVGALAVLAKEQGVSPVVAAGAALLGTLLNLGAGFGVLAVGGSGVLEALDPGFRLAARIGAVAFVLGVLALPAVAPRVVRWWNRRRGLTTEVPAMPATTLWGVVALNLIAWTGYGVAFAWFARGVTPTVSGALPAFVAVYTASYLAGYLALIAPGGLVVREVALTVSLTALGLASAPDATVLALASRLWLTVLEVLPGLVALAFAPAARRAGR